jgi:hypothetical protein
MTTAFMAMGDGRHMLPVKPRCAVPSASRPEIA